MLHSYFVEYQPKQKGYYVDNPRKIIVGFVDIITQQNIEAFKNVVLKSHNETCVKKGDSIDIRNISYLGGK